MWEGREPETASGDSPSASRIGCAGLFARQPQSRCRVLRSLLSGWEVHVRFFLTLSDGTYEEEVQEGDTEASPHEEGAGGANRFCACVTHVPGYFGDGFQQAIQCQADLDNLRAAIVGGVDLRFSSKLRSFCLRSRVPFLGQQLNGLAGCMKILIQAFLHGLNVFFFTAAASGHAEACGSVAIDGVLNAGSLGR